MRNAGSPLASLLIVSAIDLLVCCLTAGIMLFLVFQPSLRADRSSAVLNTGRSSAGTFQVPVTIIVRNSGDNQLVPSGDLPDGYEEVGAGNASLQGKTRIWRVTRTNPPLLKLAASNKTGRVAATIVVVADDKITNRTIDCVSGDQVRAEIDLSADDYISIPRCSQPTMCYRYAIVPANTPPPAWAELCLRPTGGGSLAEKFINATRNCGFERDEKRDEWISKGQSITGCTSTPFPGIRCQSETTEIIARRAAPLTEDVCGVEP